MDNVPGLAAKKNLALRVPMGVGHVQAERAGHVDRDPERVALGPKLMTSTIVKFRV